MQRATILRRKTMGATMTMKELLLTFTVFATATLGGCASGPSGLTGYQVVVQLGNLSAQEQKTFIVLCPTGKKALGGGFSGTETSLQVFENRPISDGTGWLFSAKSAWLLPSSIQANVYVVCGYAQ